MEFKTSSYEFAHGHKPRGCGAWMFQAGARTLQSQFATYAEAKAQVRRELNQPEYRHVVVTVLP